MTLQLGAGFGAPNVTVVGELLLGSFYVEAALFDVLRSENPHAEGELNGGSSRGNGLSRPFDVALRKDFRHARLKR